MAQPADRNTEMEELNERLRRLEARVRTLVRASQGRPAPAVTLTQGPGSTPRELPLEPEELDDPDDVSVPTAANGPAEPPSINIDFDDVSWEMLTGLAAREGVDLGSMLGLLIQRAAYLDRVVRNGGELCVRRGDRIYRLRARVT